MPPTTTPLATNLAGIHLANPVILAAGTAGYLDEMAGAMNLSGAGAVVTKSITALPREGNNTWRIIESRAGMLNAIGLANVGLDEFMKSMAPLVAKVPTTVIGSIAGFSIDDYVKVAAAFNTIAAMPAVELNVSCPNVHGGTEFGLDPAALRDLIGTVRAVLTEKRLFVKLSPIVAGAPGGTIIDIARAAIEGRGTPSGPNRRPGADALCLANTIPAMAVDVKTRKPRLANTTGGLSGPAVHPVAVKLVHDVYRKLAREAGIPLIGIGGVMNWHDAAEFILVGATAIEMGTALFVDPRLPAKVVGGLEKWVSSERASGIADLVGALKM